VRHNDTSSMFFIWLLRCTNHLFTYLITLRYVSIFQFISRILRLVLIAIITLLSPAWSILRRYRFDEVVFSQICFVICVCLSSRRCLMWTEVVRPGVAWLFVRQMYIGHARLAVCRWPSLFTGRRCYDDDDDHRRPTVCVSLHGRVRLISAIRSDARVVCRLLQIYLRPRWRCVDPCSCSAMRTSVPIDK